MSKVSPQQLLDLLENQRFFVQYQPIVAVQDQSIFAYEALSRFKDHQGHDISSAKVYAALHDSPLSLFQVEYAQKKRQLEYAPKHHKLFINLDQDSYFACGLSGQGNPFLTLFQQYQSSDLIVELIENSEINDAKMSLAMIKTLNQQQIATALDDCFGPLSMLSYEVIQLVEYIKLDKQVVLNKADHNFQLLVASIISYAQQAGKKTILEGIESVEDWKFAQNLGVDYVQGYYFSSEFISCQRSS